MKYVILTMKYSSIFNVAEDIAEVIRNNGNQVQILTEPLLPFQGDRLIVFVPFVPGLLNNYLLVFNNFKGEKAFYTTADGIPYTTAVNPYLLQSVTFIPNSKFSAENLMQAGIQTDLPVFHGVNFRIVQKAEEMIPKLKEKLNKDFPNTIKIGVVTGTTKRKNIDLLLKTFDELNTNFPDEAKKIHFFVISHKDFKDFQVPQNVHFVSEFGFNPREYIYAFYGAMDYTLVPSGCEGFGLPVLESMAMGTPVIHQLIPPFTEFTSWQWNILIDHESIEEYISKDHGQKWKIYRFNPTKMAILLASLTELQDRDERSKNLKEVAKKYDINFLYKRFLFD